MSNSRVFLQLALLVLMTFSGQVQAIDCPSADLTGDCSVDFEDMIIFAEQWLNYGGAANLDNIGRVNLTDFALFANDWLAEVPLVINEFMARNTASIQDEAGQNEDWIEIHNYGSTPINVGGMYLADNVDDPSTRWMFPTTSPTETTIPPGGYLIIWADDDAGNGLLHATFKLSWDNGTDDVALYDSAENLIDSIENFGLQGENHSYGRYPDASGNWRVFDGTEGNQPTPGVSNGGEFTHNNVVINEIMYHPFNADDPLREDIGAEYIELFNNGPTTIDVSGWRITDGVEFAIPAGTSIGGYGYLVIAANPQTFDATYPGANNVVGGWTGRLSNKGERIDLLNADGALIDSVRYGDEGDWGLRRLGPTDVGHRGWMWSDQHDGDGMSLELIAPHMPNEYGQNWASSMTYNGTPGMANTATGAEIETEVLITTGAVWRYHDLGEDLGIPPDGQAWFGHPDYDDSAWHEGPSQLGYGDDDEATVVDYGPDRNSKYITTYFRHEFDVSDASRYTSLTMHLLRDDGAVVYLNGAEVRRSNMPEEVDITYLTLANSSIGRPEEQTFYDYPVDTALLNNGTNIFAVEIHQGEDRSPDISFDLILEAKVKPDTTPVPTDIAPFILHVKHNPPIPQSDEDVTVTARIVDELNGGLSVILHHRIDDSIYSRDIYPSYNPGDYTPVPMFDDGAHGDGQPGDGVYGAKIPATQEDIAVVEFFVAATDAAGNSRSWPAPSMVDGVAQQVTNAIYQADDSFEGAADWNPGNMPIYRIVMTESERARLASIGSSYGNSNAQMNATFISVDGADIKVRYNVGVRNRGHGSRTRKPNNYRVNFVHDRSWKGVTAININAQYPYLQFAGSVVFRLAGLPTPDASAVRTLINGRDLTQGREFGAIYGSYVHVEAIDSDFARKHFPHNSNGNAYKCLRVGSQANLRYEGPYPAPYSEHYFKATNEREYDYSDLIELTWVLSNNTPDSIYANEVKRVIDAEQWLRFFALNTLLDNNETTLANGNGDDYYLYRGENDTRFLLIQHDLDTIFGKGDNRGSVTAPIFQAAAIPAIGRLMNHPEFMPRYYYHLNNLMETVLSAEQIGRTLDHALGGYVSQGELQDMKNFVLNRNAYVSNLIERDFTINVSLAQSGGYYRTNTNAAPLSGTADAIETRAVRVNSELAEWSPKDGAWAIGAATGGQANTLVYPGSDWLYLDDGSDQGALWREPAGYDDTGWKTGPAELGYGDSNPPQNTLVDDGAGYGPSGGKYVTTYFRRWFDVDDESKYVALEVKLMRDDGGVVYINGIEVARSNMPGILGDYTIDYLTRADSGISGSEENAFNSLPVPQEVFAGLLATGPNLIAVEIHQYSSDINTPVSSSDISFDLELIAYESGQSQGGTSLLPGVNRLTVRTYGDPNGTGQILQEGSVDVWYDDGTQSTISGTITSDRTLDAESGPWRVTGNITVPSGVTLTIAPGTTLFFDSQTGITITGDAGGLGRLIANGTEYRHIRLASVPGGGAWDGLNFLNPQSVTATPQNSLSYVDMEYGDAQAQSINVNHTRLLIDHMTWTRTDKNVIEAVHPQLIIQNSIFPDHDNEEGVHGHGLIADEYLILEGNTFGRPAGYQDVIDFSDCRRPGPILEVYNNIFPGGDDDGVDLDDCDAHIEGNVFTGFLGGTDTGTPNPLAADQGSRITVVRNLFHDNINAVLLKGNAEMDAANNTFVGQIGCAVRFWESGSSLGKGAFLDGCIFWNNAEDFRDIGTGPMVTVNNSIVPSEWHYLGLGNIDDDPLFDNNAADYRLTSFSPAGGRGANGLDMGAHVPAGASVSGGPFHTTHRTTASFAIGGPGISAYSWRLMNNGAWTGDWSTEVDLASNPQLHLAGLAHGHTYTLFVIGKNSAGRWQDEETAATWTWIVNTRYRRLIINEVLAINDSAIQHNATFPDTIELYYDGPTAIDLGGMSITDDIDESRQYVFPTPTVIAPGEFMVLYCEPNSLDTAYLNFSLNGDGDSIFLYSSPANGGGLIDSVEFGSQVPDLSIGRVAGDTWKLTTPTLGQANAPAPLGDPTTLKINEWYTAGQGDDFVELFNPHTNPVDISNLYLTDNPVTEPDKVILGPLSFVPGRGFVVFRADGSAKPGHVNFQLSSDQEIIGLFDEHLNAIDKVIYYRQTANVSQGRAPDGSETLEFFTNPSPGRVNRQTIVINEVLAHSHALVSDWIELYNSGSEPVDISGWYLSDNDNDLKKYRIPAPTVVDPNTYIVFSEDVHFGSAFALRENGDAVYLTSASNDRLTEYRIRRMFGASETNVTFGRHLKSTGDYDFVSMSTPTRGYRNADPKLGPIVISEIMYHPAGNNDAEYVELLNTEPSTVILYDPDAGQTWEFTDGDGVHFNFPSPPVLIDPDERILLVKNKSAFDSEFTAPAGTQIFEWDPNLQLGSLSNSGEQLTLSKPGDPDTPVSDRNYILVDLVEYSDGSHPLGQDLWPAQADGNGASLHRIFDPVNNDMATYGNDAANWRTAVPTPGF